MNPDSMNKYELLYIVSSQYTDQEVTGIQKLVSELLVKNGGKVVSEKNLGKIKLAYPIQKQRHGSYILTYFDAESETVKETNRLLGLMDEVLRHTMLIRPEGSESRTFEISSYVAPLSDEGKRVETIVRPRPSTPKPVKKEELAPPAPSADSTEESKMSIAELDQKLDKILEGDISDNI
jgi:small subunit ribosomal protein S6